METSGNPEAAFMGRVTASTTHEFRNILAIVKESAGLIEDLVERCREFSPEQAERLLKTASRIDAQVTRGSELLTHLNRFAHCIDRSQDGVDLDQEVEQVVFLSQRLARQGRHRLEMIPGADGLTIMVDSLRFQMALFAAVEGCLEQVPDEGSITVRTHRTATGSAIEFAAETADGSVPPSPTGAPGWIDMQTLLEDLGASLDVGEEGFPFIITLPFTDHA
jgi:C4-dicarboxylate-specific signal transduction histidine kinase